MPKFYTAMLNRDIDMQVSFTSYDLQERHDFDSYSVPIIMRAGERRFKTKKAARQWVESLNAAHGENTAKLN